VSASFDASGLEVEAHVVARYLVATASLERRAARRG
jgi:hypothetical protein